MTIHDVEAVYEDGVLKPKQPVVLSQGTEVRLTIRTVDEDYDPLDDVIGICESNLDISLADHHDEFIYGLKRRDPESS